MIYCLDTNICIDALKETYPRLKSHFKSHSPEQIKIPSLVKAELLLGVNKSKHPEKNRKIVEQFLYPYEIISFDDQCTETYALIRFDLERRGQIIGPNDLIIASIVLSHNYTLITHNTKEFSRIYGLRLNDWTQ